MPSIVDALDQLARTLDQLSSLAWLPAIAVGLTMLRVAWLRLTEWTPEIPRWLLPVELPDELPAGAVPAYGPATRRAAYPEAMRRAVSLSSGLFTLLVALLLLVPYLPGRKPSPPPDPKTKPTTYRESPFEMLRQPQPSPPRGGSPSPSLFKSFLAAAIRAVPKAPPDSLDILDRESLEHGWADLLTNGDGGAPGDGLAGEAGRWGPESFEGAEEPPEEVPSIADELPVLISMPKPIYPEMARQASQEGTVELELLVGRNGHVRAVRVRSSVPAFDDAARAAAGQAIFKPARWRNSPVAVWVVLPIRFRLAGEP